jgi:hypothetical protein
MMAHLRIERPALDAALLSFARSGHGLILGRAGVGKTFSLSLLAQALESTRSQHLILGVEDLGGATENEIRSALGYTEPSFSNALEHLFGSASSGTVIFDGFDAARDETVRTRVLGIVRSTIRRAPKGWTVLVSVRNYDASKSPTLVGLFPRSAALVPSTFQLSGVAARHFLIPELADAEVAIAVPQISGLEEIYGRANDSFRRLARIPFNLWLLERVLERNADTESLRRLQSEVQLLDLYWSTQVVDYSDGEKRAQLLRSATAIMVKARSLVFKKSDVYSDELDSAWHALFSSNVLAESGPAKQVAQFSHNILFDYAVSTLAIPDSPSGLVTFLTEDCSRPLFLRPSLLYYFSALWHSDRERFWRSFWQLMNSEPVAVKLVSRLLPPYVAAAEARSSDDLEPLLQRSQELQSEGPNAVLRVLQALRSMELNDTPLWIAFASRIAITPSQVFAWELASFLGRALDDPACTRTELRASVGETSRRLFDWAWRHRAPDQPWFDAFASTLALPLVTATFATDVKATTSIVRRILTLLREQDFPLRYLSNLADEIVKFSSDAPDVVGDVYRAIFAYEEKSDAPTSLGGIVLKLTSNRRQDFAMCQYALARDFSTFLQRAPATAIAIGFDILNSYSWREHAGGSDDRAALRRTFQFRGLERNYVQDWSVTWSHGLSHQDEATIANALENFLHETEMEPDLVVEIAAAHAETAYTWALLLEAGTRAPARYAKVLFELAVSRPIQMGLDTRHLVASFVEAAAPYWSSEQLDHFQREALSLREAGPPEDDGDRQEFRTRASDLLLTRVPPHLLSVEAARERVQSLEQAGSVPENEPAVRFSSFSRSFTSEIWLAERGVDVNSIENASLLAQAKKMETFRDAWANKRPDSEAVASFLPEMSATMTMLRGIPLPKAVEARTAVGVGGSGAPAPEVVAHLWTCISAAAHSLARSALVPSTQAFQLSREVLLRAAEFPPPKVNEKRDKEFSTPGWSPTPRTEAIEGLSYLASHAPRDLAIADRFASFAASLEPSERWLVASHLPYLLPQWPDMFWSIADARATEEHNPTVVTTLIHTIWAASAHSDEKRATILRKLLPRWFGEESSSLQQAIGRSLVRMAFFENDPWAWAQLRAIQNDLPKGHDVLRDVIVDGIVVLGQQQREDAPDRGFDKRVIDWLMHLLRDFEERARLARARLESERGTTSASTSHSLPSAPDASEELGSFQGLVAEIVRRLYFAAQDCAKTADENGNTVGAATSHLRDYLELVRPVMRMVLSFSSPHSAGVLIPSMAHDFMQLLNIYVSFNPEDALEMAAQTVASASSAGYQFDSLALKEVVRLVEVVLADYRDRISSGKPLADILRLLDVFADVGWPDALRLVWRLDEVFR